MQNQYKQFSYAGWVLQITASQPEILPEMAGVIFMSYEYQITNHAAAGSIRYWAKMSYP